MNIDGTQNKMQKKLASLCRLILSDRNTRNLFFFLLLNLFFAFVELTYGLWTNSLGLISDSFHMFFDCSALLLGLAASIVSKWKASEKFTYGFGRAEILTGLANGLFLLFIAFFIMKEAIERSFEPPEVHHERLFIISVLGFLVNLVGIFVFQHGGQGHHHHHGLGGCSHSHSPSNHKEPLNHSKIDHSHYDHNSHSYSHYSNPTLHSSSNITQQQAEGAVALDMYGYPLVSANDLTSYTTNHSSPATNHLNNNHNHSHNDITNSNHHSHHSIHYHHHHAHQTYDNQHHHHTNFDVEPLIVEPANRSSPSRSNGRGQIMQSVFLHIVADTLGSIGVMISALLMNQFGWMIADPLCSLFIAILISISVYPLLRDSFYVLMQRVPVELEDKLPHCLQKIQNLNGVLSVHETHFWTLNSDTYVGCLKLEVANEVDHWYILSTTKNLLNQIGVDKVHIQIDQDNRVRYNQTRQE